MPEGDTIFRAAAGLPPHLLGQVISAAWPDGFRRLQGLRVVAVETVGKHLLVRFEQGLVLHSHLRMTGSWEVYRPGQPWRRPRWQAKAVLEVPEAVAVLFAAPVAELRRES